MFKKIKIKVINLLLGKDINTLLIVLGIAKEEYIGRYNNPEHAGYKSESLKRSIKDIHRLEEEFATTLGINNYHKILKNSDYEEIMAQ